MPQSLFEAQQDRPLVAAGGIDHAVGMQPGTGERGSEQVTRAQAPQDRAVEAREHAGDKQHGFGAMEPAGDLVESAGRKAALRQMGIDRRDAERHDGPGGPARLRDAGDPSAQIFKNRGRRGCHDPSTAGREACSYFVLVNLRLSMATQKPLERDNGGSGCRFRLALPGVVVDGGRPGYACVMPPPPSSPTGPRTADVAGARRGIGRRRPATISG